MDPLAQVVEQAIPRVNWFALGEAKKLAVDMRNAVRDYRKTPDATQLNKLREVARQAHAFLFHRHTDEARATCSVLDKALAESRNGEKTT